MNQFPNQSGPKFLLIFLYIVLGLYFLNYPFQIIKIPTSVLGFEEWIIFAGGILLLLGSIHYFQAKRRVF